MAKATPQASNPPALQLDSLDIGSSIFTNVRSSSKIRKTDSALEAWTIDLSFLSTHSKEDIRIVTAESGADEGISIQSLFSQAHNSVPDKPTEFLPPVLTKDPPSKKDTDTNIDDTSFSLEEDFIIYPDETEPFVDEDLPLFPSGEVAEAQPGKLLPAKSNLKPSQQIKKPLPPNADLGYLHEDLTGDGASFYVTIFVKKPIERRLTQKVRCLNSTTPYNYIDNVF
jgi:hypothetical protein